MPEIFSHTLDTPVFKGTVKVNTGLFIDGKWVDPVEPSTIDVVNPVTGKPIVAVAGGSSKDVDLAVAAAQKAYKTVWGLKTPGTQRGLLLHKLADLMEKNADELTALEVLDTGKVFQITRYSELPTTIEMVRYFAGWADKIHGKTMETNESKFAYSRHEPFGVVGQIIAWNFPLVLFIAKIAPALATGNTVVIKPSEVTPLTALRMGDLINEAGFPPGTVNIVTGYGHDVGNAITHHHDIRKVSFTGSTLVGRKILAAAAESNLKDVALELGGKSPVIVFDDADVDQAVKWATQGIFFNMGQVCTAGSRIFVQEGIYDKFMEKFVEIAQSWRDATGDPFAQGTRHGPLVSQTQFNRVMSYIDSGKQEGATLSFGGVQSGTEGYYVQPTVFTDVKPEMKIMREEIFGPVASVAKFKTEEEVVEAANNTVYGLACSVFSENIKRALRVGHALEAGTAYINCSQNSSVNVPFGGYKQSGIGRELGEYALATYTQVKGVHVNLGITL